MAITRVGHVLMEVEPGDKGVDWLTLQVRYWGKLKRTYINASYKAKITTIGRQTDKQTEFNSITINPQIEASLI